MTTITGFLTILVPIAILTSVARAAASAYSVEVGHELNAMGAAMGLSNASQDLGMFVGPILFGWVTDAYGLPSMFFTGAIAGLIAVPFIIWALYARQKAPAAVAEAETINGGGSGN